MLSITPEDHAILSTRHNVEFYYVVEIMWPEGAATYGRVLEPGIQPLLISVSDIHMQGRVSGAGVTGSASAVFNDAYGIFRDKFDHLNLRTIPAIIYLRAYGTALCLPVLYGKLSEGAEWNEGDRTFKIEISTSITDEMIGYTPDIYDVSESETAGRIDHAFIQFQNPLTSLATEKYISSEFFKTQQQLNSTAWPNVFGPCVHVKIEAVAKAPETATWNHVWDLTGGYGVFYDAIIENDERAAKNEEYADLRLAAENGDYKEEIPDDIPLIDLNSLPPATGLLNFVLKDPAYFSTLGETLFELVVSDQSVICKGEVIDDSLTVTIANFDLPLYENIRVFSVLADDSDFVDFSFPMPLTAEQKDALIRTSIKANMLSQMPDYLNNEQEPVVEAVDGLAADAFTKFFIIGTYGDEEVYATEADYPWLEHSWIEAILDISPERSALDSTLNVSKTGPQWSPDGHAYVMLQVVRQRGLECIVHNPYKHKFHAIRSVRRNNLFMRDAKDLSVTARTLLEYPAGEKRGAVPANTIVRLFNWLPEKQYPVDTKNGTSVYAIKHQTVDNNYLALPSESYLVLDMQPGDLWAGYHPQCTVVTLGYNAYLRVRYAQSSDLYADLNNDYVTDEDIIAAAVDQLNANPDSYAFQPILFKRSEFSLDARPSFFMLAQEASLDELVSSIARQNGKLVRGYGSTIELVDFMHAQLPRYTFDESNILAQSIRLGLTQEVQTAFNVTYSFNDTRIKPINLRRKSNVSLYGFKSVDWIYNTHLTVNESLDVVNFWILYHSNIWRTISFTATFESVGLEVFDAVTIDISRVPNFSHAYPEVVGPDVVNPVERVVTNFDPATGITRYRDQEKQFPIYSVTGIITEMDFNVESGTIQYSIWLPILAGQTTKCPLLWEVI